MAQGETASLSYPDIKMGLVIVCFTIIMLTYAQQSQAAPTDMFEINSSTHTANEMNDGYGRSRRSIPSCNEPTKDSLKSQWIAYQSDSSAFRHESYYSYTNLTQEIKTELDKSKYEQYIYLGASNENCPSASQGSGATEMRDRSSCPWIYILNMDSKRYPQELVEAKCRNCQKCIGLSNNSVYTCQPMYYNVKVLRKSNTCKNGAYVYQRSWQKITVGCTCAQRST